MKVNLKAVLIAVVSLIFSCKQAKVISHNEKLSGVHTEYVYDADTIPNLKQEMITGICSKKIYKLTDTVQYANGMIHVSCLRLLTGCGDYTGDIQFKDDTIMLFTVNKEEYVCTEQVICRLSYTIENKSNKHYIFQKD